MTKQQQLISLLALGWPERRIASELGIHRNTVRRYAEQQDSKCTKTTAESELDSTSPRTADSASAPRRATAVRRPFIAAAHKSEIEQAIAAGDTAQVIYQFLVETHQYRGSYQSVKRYVRHLKAGLPKRVVGVMHHASGEEAQVDYFKGAPTLHPLTHRYQRPWVFRMTLCHSRHG
jgi:IS30 family transposase